MKRHHFQHKAAVVIFLAVQGRGQLRGGEATGWQAELDSVTLSSRTWPSGVRKAQNQPPTEKEEADKKKVLKT